MSEPDAAPAAALERFLANIDRTVDERLSRQRIEEYLKHVKEVAASTVPHRPASGTIHSDEHVIVIGAGVSGLTTAICLAEAQHKVRIVSRDLPLHTPSVAAAASWGYYLGDERNRAWSEETLRQLRAMASDPATGVRMIECVEASRDETSAPHWVKSLLDYRACVPSELPQGFVSGWRYTAPVVDMPEYLRYLTDRLRDSKTAIELATVESLDQIDAPLIVNCAGIGAAALTGDQELVPVRGQLVVVKNPGIEEYFEDHTESEDLTYFLPHGDIVVIGGSAVRDRGEAVAPDPEVSARIIARAAAIEPKLANAEVLGHRVGIRPSRPTVRLERTVHNGRTLIHNYGHGGAGLTLSWGCAKEVLSFVSGPSA